MKLIRFPGTKPSPKRKLLRRLLSQPWIGPSISLVVLSVSIASLCVATLSLIYNKAGYDRQTLRWQVEDESPIQLQLQIQPDLTSDGWRSGVVQFYFRVDNPMQLETIEAVAPDGVEIRAFDPAIVRPGTAKSNFFELNERVGSSSQDGPRNILRLLIRTPKTPLDQNTVVQIRARAFDLSNERRHIERETRAVIPSDAKK